MRDSPEVPSTGIYINNNSNSIYNLISFYTAIVDIPVTTKKESVDIVDSCYAFGSKAEFCVCSLSVEVTAGSNYLSVLSFSIILAS